MFFFRTRNKLWKMVKRVLDELQWHPEKSLKGAKITYIHRGAPNDKVFIDGSEIVRLEQGHFVLNRGGRETWIPYHRITSVECMGDVLYKKQEP